MSNRAVNHLSDELDRLIDWHVMEYRLSYAEIVGVLTMTATKIAMHCAMRNGPQEPPEEDGAQPVNE